MTEETPNVWHGTKIMSQQNDIHESLIKYRMTATVVGVLSSFFFWGTYTYAGFIVDAKNLAWTSKSKHTGVVIAASRRVSRSARRSQTPRCIACTEREEIKHAIILTNEEHNFREIH